MKKLLRFVCFLSLGISFSVAPDFFSDLKDFFNGRGTAFNNMRTFFVRTIPRGFGKKFNDQVLEEPPAVAPSVPFDPSVSLDPSTFNKQVLTQWGCTTFVRLGSKKLTKINIVRDKITNELLLFGIDKEHKGYIGRGSSKELFDSKLMGDILEVQWTLVSSTIKRDLQCYSDLTPIWIDINNMLAYGSLVSEPLKSSPSAVGLNQFLMTPSFLAFLADNKKLIIKKKGDDSDPTLGLFNENASPTTFPLLLGDFLGDRSGETLIGLIPGSEKSSPMFASALINNAFWNKVDAFKENKNSLLWNFKPTWFSDVVQSSNFLPQKCSVIDQDPHNSNLPIPALLLANNKLYYPLLKGLSYPLQLTTVPDGNNGYIPTQFCDFSLLPEQRLVVLIDLDGTGEGYPYSLSFSKYGSMVPSNFQSTTPTKPTEPTEPTSPKTPLPLIHISKGCNLDLFIAHDSCPAWGYQSIVQLETKRLKKISGAVLPGGEIYLIGCDETNNFFSVELSATLKTTLQKSGYSLCDYKGKPIGTTCTWTCFFDWVDFPEGKNFLDLQIDTKLNICGVTKSDGLSISSYDSVQKKVGAFTSLYSPQGISSSVKVSQISSNPDCPILVRNSLQQLWWFYKINEWTYKEITKRTFSFICGNNSGMLFGVDAVTDFRLFANNILIPNREPAKDFSLGDGIFDKKSLIYWAPSIKKVVAYDFSSLSKADNMVLSNTMLLMPLNDGIASLLLTKNNDSTSNFLPVNCVDFILLPGKILIVLIDPDGRGTGYPCLLTMDDAKFWNQNTLAKFPMPSFEKSASLAYQQLKNNFLLQALHVIELPQGVAVSDGSGDEKLSPPSNYNSAIKLFYHLYYTNVEQKFNNALSSWRYYCDAMDLNALLQSYKHFVDALSSLNQLCRDYSNFLSPTPPIELKESDLIKVLQKQLLVSFQDNINNFLVPSNSSSVISRDKMQGPVFYKILSKKFPVYANFLALPDGFK